VRPSGAGRREVSARASLGLWSPALGGLIVGGLLITGGSGVGTVMGVALLLVGLVMTVFAMCAWLVVVDGVLYQRVLCLPTARSGWLSPVDLRRLVSVQQRRHGPGRRRALVLTVRDAFGVEREVHLAAWAPARKVQRVINGYAKQCRVPVRQP
jgi:hypothetical protein